MAKLPNKTYDLTDMKHEQMTSLGSSTPIGVDNFIIEKPRKKSYFPRVSYPLVPVDSFSFDGSLRSSDPIMGFVREFVVEFMQKVDSEYKFVRRDHFDEKTYCKVHNGDFITIRDIFDIQLKEEKDEREFRKANLANVV